MVAKRNNKTSPIGWIGGKTKLAPTIISCLYDHNVYVEIFGGSMVVFFNKQPSKIEIVNDIHNELVNLMKVLSGTYFDKSIKDEFVQYVMEMPSSRSLFVDWQRCSDDDLSKMSPAQRAFRYYYCIKNGFSSLVSGGYASSPLSRSRYNMNTDFEQFSSRFKKSNAQIECMDFRDLITKYSNDRAEVTFFADPPYFVADNTNYYDHVFTPKDHEDLKASCDAIHKNGNKFLITYDDHNGVIDLYKDYYIYRTDPLVYSASEESSERKNIKCELFITNYNLCDMLINKFAEFGHKKKIPRIYTKADLNDRDINIPECVGLHRI